MSQMAVCTEAPDAVSPSVGREWASPESPDTMQQASRDAARGGCGAVQAAALSGCSASARAGLEEEEGLHDKIIKHTTP